MTGGCRHRVHIMAFCFRTGPVFILQSGRIKELHTHTASKQKVMQVMGMRRWRVA